MTGDELQGLAIMLLIVIVGYGPYDFSKYRRVPSFRHREMRQLKRNRYSEERKQLANRRQTNGNKS